MGDGTAEGRRLAELGIGVQGMVIAGHVGKGQDVRIGDGMWPAPIEWSSLDVSV